MIGIIGNSINHCDSIRSVRALCAMAARAKRCKHERQTEKENAERDILIENDVDVASNEMCYMTLSHGSWKIMLFCEKIANGE